MNAITKEFTRVMPKKLPGLVIVTAGILPLYILGVAGKTAAIPLSLLILVAMVMVAAFMGPKLSLAISPLVALGFAGTAYFSDKPLAGALFIAVVAFLCRAAMVSSKAAMLNLIAIFIAIFITGPPLLTGHNPVAWDNIRDIFLWTLGACLWASFIGWLLTLRVPIPKLPALPLVAAAFGRAQLCTGMGVCSSRNLGDDRSIYGQIKVRFALLGVRDVSHTRGGLD